MECSARVRRLITARTGGAGSAEEGNHELDEETFRSAALDVFAEQYERIEVVRRLADRLGRTPATVTRWQDIPAVPPAAFKYFDVLASGLAAALVFESSGTSGRRRSRSPFTDEGLDLMEVAIRVNAERMLFPDGRGTRILILAPPPELAPQMIMAWGMRRLITHFGLPDSDFLIGPDGLDMPRLMTALGGDVPICLIGASFGFVHLLDGLVGSDRRFTCPSGSRTMDAGGFKGRSRVLTRGALTDAITDRLGIPAHRALNLLGMTELPSQFYDDVLRTGRAGRRRKTSPPWTRTRVIDPVTLEDVPHGRSGILWHLDLANTERPMVIQTNDIGRVDDAGWEIVGRASGSETRGCSLTVEELLS